MMRLNVFALLGVVALTGAVALLLPQDRASAADDTITIRAQLDKSNSVIIQREYLFPTRWVTVGVIPLDIPTDGDIFEYGTMSLAVEFIPDFRLPCPRWTGSRPASVATSPRHNHRARW